MTQLAHSGTSPADWLMRLTSWRREIAAGITVAFVTLPVCLASGVLAYAPLGNAYLGAGAAAGLQGAIYGGICAALVASSSFIASSPRTSIAIVQASVVASLLASASIPLDPVSFSAALALLVLLAGLWEILFGVVGIARIIKFTPHPVLAGFVNGVALLIVSSQLKSFIMTPERDLTLPPADKLSIAASVCLVAASVLGAGTLNKKIPALLTGMVLGCALFYLAKVLLPGLDLGGTIGDFGSFGAPSFPFGNVIAWTRDGTLLAALPDVLTLSLALAVVATFESLLTIRAAQNLADLPVQPRRDIVAQGFGNCAAAFAGGVAIAASPPQTKAAFNLGGRTRLTGVVAALCLLIMATAMPGVLAAIPNAVLSGLLLANGLQLFDRWSFRIVRDACKRLPWPERRRSLADILIILVVMALTASVSVVAGIVAGFVLACGVFIVNMSRPIVRHRYIGLSSKRFRSADDEAILRDTESCRVVLALEGVLFFGNADELSRTVTGIFREADVVVLDLRGIADIDVSGATILTTLFERSRKQGKRLLFCNVPAAHSSTITGIAAGAAEPAIFHDRDSTLEWIEEQTLRKRLASRPRAECVSLDDHDFTRGLDEQDLTLLRTYLVERELPAGTMLCIEGEPANRLWLLMRGSVSVRLRVADSRGSRRMASLAVGTITGGQTLLESGARRLADVIADEPVACYELERKAFEGILRDHPALAAKLLINVGRDFARRLRTTFDDFREVTS